MAARAYRPAPRPLHPERPRRDRHARQRRPSAPSAVTRGRTGRRRILAIDGTGLTAILEGQPVGYLERVSSAVTPAASSPSTASPISETCTSSWPNRRCGIVGWLVGQAADWLDLGHLDRLLDDCSPDDGYGAFCSTSASARSLTPPAGNSGPPTPHHELGLRQRLHRCTSPALAAMSARRVTVAILVAALADENAGGVRRRLDDQRRPDQRPGLGQEL